MRCPNGSRKNKQGECITISVPNVKRCPNGTRKNKQGVCEPKEPKTEPKPVPKDTKPVAKVTKTKRCPNGTQKNKQGVCVPNTPDTPRTTYSRRFKQIVMSKNKMFQVHFDSPEQFTKYVNLSNAPKLDCGYQTLFALGLLNAKDAKKGAEEVNAKGTKGIHHNDIKMFLRTNFEFKPTETIISKKSWHAEKFLEDKLENNHATILLLQYEWGGHYVIAYKYKNKIYFFDSQRNKHIKVEDKTFFFYLKVKVEEEKIFKPIQCELPYKG